MTENIIPQLAETFLKVQTIQGKLRFWRNKLKTEYYDFAISIDKEEHLEKFQIIPQSPQQIKELNLYYLEETKARNENALLDLNNLKADFEKDFSNVKNSKEFISQKLDEIKAQAQQTTSHNISMTQLFSTKNKVPQNTYHCKAYEDYLLYGKEVNLREKEYLPYELIQALNGQTWAEYQIYVSERLSTKKAHSSKPFTLTKQLLILEYLGLGDNLGTNKEKANLFAPLINRSTEDIRQELSSLEKYKSKTKNEHTLLEIRDYFLKLGLEKQIKLIEKDLDKYYHVTK